MAQGAACTSVPPDDDGTSCGQSHDTEPLPGCTVTLEPGEELTEECVIVAPVDGSCPAIESVNADDLVNGTAVCGIVPGEGGGAPDGVMGGAGGAGGAGEPQLKCCYPVISEMGCPGGRPFLVDGCARVAGFGSTGRGWQAARAALPVSDIPAAARRRIAAEWVADGLMEHASVAAFAKFTLELLALGAPFDLVRDSQRAMADEIRHARRCFDLAAAYGQNDVVLGRLDFGSICADASLASVVESTIIEGCVGETIAAAVASRAAAVAEEHDTAAVLAEISDDESRHAELAWRFVAWAVARDASLLPVVASAFDRAIAALARGIESAVDEDEHAAHLAAHGRLSAVGKQRAIQVAITEVIDPCRDALLARRRSDSCQGRATC